MNLNSTSKQVVKQNLKRVTYSSFTYDNVDVTYDTIISAMTSVAKVSVSTRKVSKFLKPYWFPALGNFHKNLRTSRCAWIADGKPRNRESYDRYKNFKRDFLRNLRTASSHYEQAELKKLNDLSETDQTQPFGKCLTRRKAKHATIAANLCLKGLRRTLLMVCYRAGKDTLKSEDKSFDDNVRDKVERAVDS